MTQPPSISLIMPVYNGRDAIDRALRSVVQQTYSAWEAVAVDDGSSDGSFEVLQTWAKIDARIRPIRLSEKAGASAARNAGVHAARGNFVTYLDVGFLGHDDEYAADYFEQVARHCNKAEMLYFGYDMVFEAGPDAGKTRSWDSSKMCDALFVKKPAAPLGVAHTRELWQRLGGFDERLWEAEDWDFFKRAARAGVEAVYLPVKSGRMHVRAVRSKATTQTTTRQREAAIKNWEAGLPIFAGNGERCSRDGGQGSLVGDAADGTGTVTATLHASPTPTVKKIVFMSPHCLIDPTSGAAVATAQAMQFLQSLGFECRAFCGSRLDLPERIESMLDRNKIAYRPGKLLVGTAQVPVVAARMEGFAKNNENVKANAALEVTIVRNEFARHVEFYQAFDAFLGTDRPDMVITYGGDPLADAVVRILRSRDLPHIFWLHNFAYYDVHPFKVADYVIVPSQFNRKYYWNSLGLAAQVVPLVIDWARVEVPNREPRYVTFVNPQLTKGVYVFARIAEGFQLGFFV